ncbi:NAD-dependent epimerase/dehydratase [Paenibacillus sp. FSL R7-269]|uniref:polysaccharide biosynthesis C-terminal domain-containing protein n=1 Tax=Paenibacillus sp. FSL R7-269 TaxID=1226755 RepID=UPI0003E20205|nr:NAD-dependent epimerase/dehydratase family protein [Paenibacillus sp. FSL R7-269]ETT45161.1 NAD-dependent epimerase/dehydratase [Paenibacillus sp. FSL R7-269]
MKTILVTGAYGFIGRNLIASLKCKEDIEILRIGSKNSLQDLEEYALKADFIFHLAGINRPMNEEEFITGNFDYTQHLINILHSHGKNTPIVLSSSTQAQQDNSYGKSKRAAEEVVLSYGREVGVDTFVYRLPNVFGKWSKPNYNSVVATWCFNISRDIPIQVNNPDAEITLVYIDDVVDSFINKLDGMNMMNSTDFYEIPRSFSIKLKHLEASLLAFKKSRHTLVISDLKNDFERFLYSTYLSYLPEDDFGYDLEMKHDNRGWLAEFIKTEHSGQVFISRTKPGITRGNHWHHTKVEKFLVIEGEAIVNFRHIESEQIIEYPVNGRRLKVIDIPPGYTHSITNTGTTEVITLFWANELFNPDKPDTYYLEV